MEAKIRKAAKEQFGQEPGSVEKAAEGLMHETYTFEVSGKEYVIQFSGSEHENHSALGQCLNFYRLLKDSDIPVPEPVTEEVMKIEREKYSIVERIPGENMEQNISPEKVRKSGKMLAKIHEFTGFDREGWIDFEDGEVRVYPFEEGSLKQRTLGELEGKLEVFRDHELRELADELEKFFEKNEEKEFGYQPVLCHDDFSPDNILWKDGEITGVIDFDFAFSGNPYRNVVKAANAFWMHDPGADWDIRKTFYEGYQEVRELGENFEENEHFYRVQTLTWLVAGLIEMGELSEYEKEFYRDEILEELEPRG